MSLRATVIQSPLGKLKITCRESSLLSIEFDCLQALSSPISDMEKFICRELNCYFRAADYPIEIPTFPQGTDFQLEVWAKLRAIPVGEVWTYGQLAKELSTSPRAVGNACRKNPIPIIVPCHRVIAATGLGGFAGEREGTLTEIKKKLLRHEGVIFD